MMTDELKRRVGQILAEEEGPDVDWDAVAAMSAQLAADLGHSLPPIAQDYLVSVERRREDSVLALAQRSVLVQYLRSEQCNAAGYQSTLAQGRRTTIGRAPRVANLELCRN